MSGSALVVACVVLLAARSDIGADPDERWLRFLQFGFYTGVGVFVDWLREGRTVVFRVERPPGVSVAPLFSRHAAGIGLRVSF